MKMLIFLTKVLVFKPLQIKDEHLKIMGISCLMLILALENERTNIKKRQEQGIAAAKARGVGFGHPERPVPDNFGDTVKKWERGCIKFDDAVGRCDMSAATFYRRLREYRMQNNK